MENQHPTVVPTPEKRVPAEEWRSKPPFQAKSILAAFGIFLLLGWTGHNTEIPRMLNLLGDWSLDIIGVRESSQVGTGFDKVAQDLFPIALSDKTPISRIENLDRENLPRFSRLEVQEIREVTMNSDTFELEEQLRVEEYLVEPLGYLWHVIEKMVETLEIALWGTFIAIVVSIPLAYLSARNYTPNLLLYQSARALVGMLRSVPELISALFLVLAFGFGPIAGILALGLHAAGFLGKFYAEDIENAEKGSQEALLSLGSSKPKVLWYAVMPQVLPSYVAYNLYILDRNVRMATVIGIVGAGGIGQELKGRYDMFNYGHVATILLVMFVTVFTLDQLSARIRKKLIR